MRRLLGLCPANGWYPLWLIIFIYTLTLWGFYSISLTPLVFVTMLLNHLWCGFDCYSCTLVVFVITPLTRCYLLWSQGKKILQVGSFIGPQLSFFNPNFSKKFEYMISQDLPLMRIQETSKLNMVAAIAKGEILFEIAPLFHHFRIRVYVFLIL